MKQTDRDNIVRWLSSPRKWEDGLALYMQFGTNLVLRKKFSVNGPTEINREMLVEQMRQLAGLTSAQLRALPRRAMAPRPEPVAEVLSEETKQLRPVDETTQKVIKFRDKYTFLNSPDCPDAMKICTADLFTSHRCYFEAFRQLQEDGDNADALAAAEKCRTIVEEYLRNREIRAELDYYLEHGVVLGEYAPLRKQSTEDFDPATLGDIELVGKLNSARANTTKSRKAAEANPDDEAAAKRYAMWVKRKEALEAEAARRKKK